MNDFTPTYALIWITCPYCGHAARYRLPFRNSLTKEILSCDIDSGGCDRYFAAHMTLIPKVVLFKMEEVI